MHDVASRWSHEPNIMPTAADASNLDVKTWIQVGSILADQTVYHTIMQGESPDAIYARDQADLCRRQAMLAGFRLANLLNKILD